MSVDIRIGDCRDLLPAMADRSVHSCITSPPYFAQRNYGVDGQMGREATPEAYIAALVDLFAQVRRVLRDDGTFWLNIGDAYGKDKSLLGLPWRVALALRADGWIIRQEVIWHKPVPAPERVRDRPTRAHEQMFLLTKRKHYYFDAAAISEKSCAGDARPQTRRARELATLGGLTDEHIAALRACGISDAGKAQLTQTGFGRNAPRTKALADEAKAVLGGYTREFLIGETRNKRSVWTVPVKPFKGAHLAPFPPALIEPCVLAGCPLGGTVLDPFAGSGTTGFVAQKHGRRAILIELDPECEAMMRQRVTHLGQHEAA